MQTYSEYAPTGFDSTGLGLDDRQDWLVLGGGQSRDSEALDLSNFQAALEILGGESDTVEVHRFGHWACGWLEIIIVKPDTDEHTKALEIEIALENYPVLNDEDFSEREHAEALETIECVLPLEFQAFASVILSSLNETAPESITEDKVMDALKENEIAIRCTDKQCNELVPYESVQVDGAAIGLCRDCTLEILNKLENAVLIALEDTELSDYVRRTLEDSIGRSTSPYHTPDLLPACC